MLDASRLGRPLPNTPLVGLGIFQNYLYDQLDGVTPQSQTVIDFLLTEMLTAQIDSGLRHHRRLHRLAAPQSDTTMAVALAQLEHDFRIGSPELEAWSLLYFRYVRVDLALEWAQIAPVTLQHERTLRRRVQHGLRRLAYVLIAAELAFRHNGTNQPHTEDPVG